MEALKLIRPTEEYLSQVWEYRQECVDAGSRMDGCGPMEVDQTPEEWLAAVRAYTDPATLPEGKVLSTQFITVRESDNRLVGMLQVRHSLNDHLRQYGGHIGYSVRPSERQKGYAKEQLRQALIWCRETLGLDEVMVFCYDTNEASRRTILKAGGVYEGRAVEPDKGKNVEHYRIAL